MNGVKDKIWFLREGLFAKYVIALVGLVVFVLAVNGAMETWISYRGIKTSLTDGMSEKAEATAKRIEQSMSDLERQISWVTRAYVRQRSNSAAPTMPNCCGRCRPVSQLSLLNGQGREQLRLSRTQIATRQQRRFLPRRRASPKPSRAASALRRPISAASGRSCRSRCRIPASTPASPSPRSTCASCRISWATPRSARSPLPMSSIRRARCWRPRPRAPRSARICRRCRRSQP